MGEPITNLSDAVRELGALPVPVGPEPRPLLDLVEIDTRAAYLYEYATLTDEPLQADADQLTGTDVPALVAEVRGLRSQVAALLSERHVTNEALDDAAKALREQRDRIAELEAAPAVVPSAYELATREHLAGQLGQVIDRCAKRAAQAEMPLRRDLIARGMGLLSALHLLNRGSADNTEDDGEFAGYDEAADPPGGFPDEPIPYVDPVGFPAETLLARRGVRPAGRPSVDESADKLTALLAPSQVLREDEEAECERPAAPEFFEVGRTYLRFVGDRELYFRVTSVSADNPNRADSLAGDGPVAHGWGRTDRSTTVWNPTGHTSFGGWHDVTEAGAR